MYSYYDFFEQYKSSSVIKQKFEYYFTFYHCEMSGQLKVVKLLIIPQSLCPNMSVMFLISLQSSAVRYVCNKVDVNSMFQPEDTKKCVNRNDVKS